MVDLDEEQKEIVNIIEQLSKTSKIVGEGRRFSWNRFNGNMACNVIRAHLGKHLKNSLAVVGPAFIKDYPAEFDLLIVDAKAKSEEFTDAYDKESVHLAVEVRSHGTYGENALKKIKDKFENLMKKYSINSVYLGIRESCMPTRGTKNFMEDARKILHPYKFFVLRDSRTRKDYPNQWKEFVNLVNSI